MEADEPFYSLALDDAEDMGYIIHPTKQEEISMWRAVIVRAIKDALAIDRDDPRLHRVKRNQTDAECWFYEAGDDFKRVCEYAELEPKHVQYAVLDFLTSPNAEGRNLSFTGGSKTKHKPRNDGLKEAA